MKRYILSLFAIVAFAIGAKAMGYEEARREALYLTDKMAYELNLNDQQYEYAYEINLDYLMGITTADDIFGNYLTYRNADLRHILYDWQWTLFTAADYFFRPVYWRSGAWYFPIYGYYSSGYYFRSCPSFYYSYRGGHCRNHYRDGWYASRRPHWDGGWRGHDRAFIGHGHVGASPRGGHYESNRGSIHTGRGYSIGERGANRGSYEGGRGGHVTNRPTGGNYHVGESNRGSVNSSTRTTVDRGNYGGISSERGTRNPGSSSYSGSSRSSGGSYSGSTRPSSGSYSGSSRPSGGSYSGSTRPSSGSYSGGSATRSGASGSVGSGRGGSSQGGGFGGRGHGR